MNLRKLLAIVLCLMLVFTMVLTGCNNNNNNNNNEGNNNQNVNDDNKNNDEKDEPDENKEPVEVTINLGAEPPQMNPLLTTDVVSMNVMRHVFEGLTRLDQNNEAIPGVAESWEISDDALTYTFKLRKDAKWSDGEPVTAKDFEYSYKEVLNPDTGAPYSYIFFHFKNAAAYASGEGERDDVGITAVDDYTLKLELEAPTPYLLKLLSFGVYMPIRQDLYEGDKEGYGVEADSMLYNGPYVIDSWAHDDNMVLVKNDNYWNKDDKDGLNIDIINFLMVTDANTSMNMFFAGDFDMVGVAGEHREKVVDEGYDLLGYDDGSAWYYEFNLNDPVMTNNKIRKAFTYALDRAGFVENVVRNDSMIALSFTAPAIAGNKDKFYKEVGDVLVDNNQEEAQKLLAEGMEELGLDELPTISFLCGDSSTAQKHAQAFQEAWKRNLGVTVEIVALPFKGRLERMQNNDFQMVYAGWGPDYDDPMTFLDMFETGNGNNHTSYSSAAYDKLLDEIRAETDRDTRFAKLVELEKLLLEDMPVGPIYFRVKEYTVDGLKGIVRNAFQDINLYWAEVE